MEKAENDPKRKKSSGYQVIKYPEEKPSGETPSSTEVGKMAKYKRRNSKHKRPEKEIRKSNKGMQRHDKGVRRSGKGMKRSDKRMRRSDKGIRRSGKGIRRSDKVMQRQLEGDGQNVNVIQTGANVCECVDLHFDRRRISKHSTFVPIRYLHLVHEAAIVLCYH